MNGRVPAIAGAVLLAAAPSAHAHLVETGFGAFYDGIAHVAVTPADLLVVVAVALLAGLRGTCAARRALFALPAAWLAGGVAGALGLPVAGLGVATTVSFGAVGVMVALDARLRAAAIAGIAAVVGFAHGLFNGATIAAGGSVSLALAGAVCAVFFLTAVLGAETTRLPAGWPRIAVRVGGSWIAATALLMLGWLMRPGTGT